MLRSLFVLLILIPGFFLALRDRFVALLLYIWFALFRPQEWLWIDITALRLSLILGMILVLSCLLSGRWPDLSHPLSKGAFLIVIFALAAQVNAVNPTLGWLWIDYLFRLVLVSLFITRLVSTPRELMLVITVIAVSLGFHTSKSGLVSLLGGGVRFEDGLGGAFSTNNGYGIGAAMITFMLLTARQGFTHHWVRLGFLTAALFSAFTVVSTYSRGAFLGLVAGTLAIILCQRRHRARYLVGLLLVGSVAYAIIPSPAGYVDRLQTMTVSKEKIDDSAASRPHYWRVAVDMAIDHPFGVGLRNFSVAYNSYDFSGGRYGWQRDVHSSYFQMVAETGFGGGLLFVGLLLYTCLVLLRVRSRVADVRPDQDEHRFFLGTANGLLATMVAFMVAGAFGSYALNDLTWYTMAITVALDRISNAVLNSPSSGRNAANSTG